MILDTYQLASEEEIINRGYSSTCRVQNEDGNTYFAKWIKGVKKNSQSSKILFDKLRHLKKAAHLSLPKIIEYDWDNSQHAYCVIFENKDAETLEENIQKIRPVEFLKGIEQIVSCLKLLQQDHRLTHGDITPANILVDDNLNFYLIDFGIADISSTLSQESELEIFAKEFAAPEKWNRNIQRGFAFQSDVFSVGRVIEWFFSKKNLLEFEDVKFLIDNSCKQNPSDRINYNALLSFVEKITSEISFDNQNIVFVVDADSDVLNELNDTDFKPIFDVLPKGGENVLLDLVTKSYVIHCLWIISEKKLLFRNGNRKEAEEKKYNRVKKYGRKLGLPISFKSSRYYLQDECLNLSPIFKKILKEKQYEGSYKNGKEETSKELQFYKDLLGKEKEVLEQNSLRLKYISYKKKGNYEISFQIQDSDKFSKNGLIYNHIDKATPPSPEDFEYVVCASSDKKENKNPMKFSGVAYDFNKGTRILKFRDCERLDFDKIPSTGYIFENISKQEEEKNRQLEAIRKVKFNEVQNRDLIHYLFNPTDLKGRLLSKTELDKIYQTDDAGVDFKYSNNQQRAIINGLYREPLTVIQGPPGTGKTTVITEIVFQILAKNPEAKILITSQTNDAVDNVLDNLLQKNIPIVRLSGIRKPKASLQKHTLERKIEGWKQAVRKKAKKKWKEYDKQFNILLENENIILRTVFDLISIKSEWHSKRNKIENLIQPIKQYEELLNSLNSEDEFLSALNKFSKIKFENYFLKKEIHQDWLAAISSLDENSNINQKLIDSIRVIGSTTNHIASKKYKKYNFEFDYVIMDESGKATVAESLIPLVMAEKAILVGDHRQLRPTLTANREVEKWLRGRYKEEAKSLESWDDYFNRPSLFEQIIENIDDDFKSQLEECRRSSKDQVKLTSKCFYEPFGDEPITYIGRPQNKEHNIDLKVDSSIVFLDVGNSYKSETDGNGSSKNTQSAKLIPQLIKRLDKYEIVNNYSIGVITGYTAQLKEIRHVFRTKINYKQLKHIKPENVDISVVDKFQGLEKDIVIFDLVRSQQASLGFLSNANRINVALSRQKKLLIIIGNLDSILSAKAFNTEENECQTPALHRYLKELKPEWIVKTIEQIF